MGGFGSGRPSGSGRGKVESCRSLDANRLHKAGCLLPGWWGGWQWTSNGEKVASIMLRAEADRLHLSYRVRIGGGEWEDVAETVRIVRAPWPIRRRETLFHLPWRGERHRLRAARRQAARTGPVFPLPPLLSPRPFEPERERVGSRGTACEENQTAPWRRSRYSRAVSEEAKGHVAAHL